MRTELAAHQQSILCGYPRIAGGNLAPNKEGAPPVPLHLPLDGIPSNASTSCPTSKSPSSHSHISAFDAMAAAAADDDDEGSATSADKEADKEANKECRTWVRERNCCA